MICQHMRATDSFRSPTSHGLSCRLTHLSVICQTIYPASQLNFRKKKLLTCLITSSDAVIIYLGVCVTHQQRDNARIAKGSDAPHHGVNLREDPENAREDGDVTDVKVIVSLEEGTQHAGSPTRLSVQPHTPARVGHFHL